MFFYYLLCWNLSIRLFRLNHGVVLVVSDLCVCVKCGPSFVVHRSQCIREWKGCQSREHIYWDQVGIIQGLCMSRKDVDDRKISMILYGNIKAETKTRAMENGVLFS